MTGCGSRSGPALLFSVLKMPDATVGGGRYSCAMLADMSVLSMLDRDVYLYSEVDRLIGLRGGTTRRWINGYERAGKQYDPILRSAPRATEWVTWGEFVEARVLAEFREEVPTRRLRAAVESLRATYRIDYPLAHLRPYLSAANRELTIGGGEVGLEEAQMVVRTGQLLISEGWPVVQRAQLGTDEQGEKYVAELAADDEFPGIVVNPRRYSGQPTFVGRRVSVERLPGWSTLASGQKTWQPITG